MGDFGFQKARVGVRVKNGSYVPPGTSTVGSEITLIDTDQNGVSTTTKCTTQGGTVKPADSTASFCTFNLPSIARPAVVTEPAPSDTSIQDFYFLLPGHSLSITQSNAEANLLKDLGSVNLPACTLPVLSDVKVHRAAAAPICDFTSRTQYVFEDTGLPPTATNDHATTPVNTPVHLDILANDSVGAAGAPISGLAVTTPPSHGTATVNGTVQQMTAGRALKIAFGRSVTYVPKPGFVGIDHFTYHFSTPNGTAMAIATITVTAPPPVAVDDSRTTPFNTPITIDVTANDDAKGGGALTVSSVGDPKHGTAKLNGTSVLYTPTKNFSGTDSFVYSIKTAYGAATATVTVTIDAPAPGPQHLADTGVPSDALLNYSLGLLLAGGVATTLGRRRRVHARHGI